MDQLAGAIYADSARPPGIYAFEIVDYDRDLSVGFDVLVLECRVAPRSTSTGHHSFPRRIVA
jgi:hypothetical protein